MIDVNDLRKGVTFELDGELYRVVEYHHHKPGRGNAVIRTKIRNLRTGSLLDKTFQSGDRVQNIRVENLEMQYLYNDGNLYYFMDTGTYDQRPIDVRFLEDVVGFLKEGMTVIVQDHDGEALGVELPTTVDLQVTQADAAVRGDTATGVNKYVTLETGARVQVPSFVNEGDTIRVDTRTSSYVTRV